MFRKLLPIGVIAGAVMSCAGSAQGALILTGNSAASTEQTGANYLAELSYAFIAGNQGTLSVLLTNTSNASLGGALTSFVFHVGSSDPAVAAVLTASSRPAMTDAAGSSAAPFGGSYIGGAGTGGSFEGGGPPSGGIAPGLTGSFSFDIFASDAESLTSDSFNQGPYDFNFVVRFRGMDNEAGSDKVPGTRIPSPGTIALLGMAGMLAATRRRDR